MIRALREYLRRQEFGANHVERLIRMDDSRWRSEKVKRVERDYAEAHPGEGVPLTLCLKIWFGPHGLHASSRGFADLALSENPLWALMPRAT